MNTINLAESKAAALAGTKGTRAAARQPAKEVTILDLLSDAQVEKAIAAVASQFSPQRFIGLAENAVKKAPLLAQCDPQVVLGAFMMSAALGLEPNTTMQQAFLIPYKKRVQGAHGWEDSYQCEFHVGARGYVTLAHRSPRIATLQSESIHEQDLFEHILGTNSFLKYQKRLKDRGELIGSFCFTKLADGNEMATVLPFDEIVKIRATSDTYTSLVRAVEEARSDAEKATAQQRLDDTPWVKWADDMAAKSATKKHAKQLPLAPGDALSIAANVDGDNGRTIDMAAMADADRLRAVMQDGVDAVDAPASSNETYSARPAMPAPEAAPVKDTPELAASLPRAEAAEAVESAGAPQPAAATEPSNQIPPSAPALKPARSRPSMSID